MNNREIGQGEHEFNIFWKYIFSFDISLWIIIY